METNRLQEGPTPCTSYNLFVSKQLSTQGNTSVSMISNLSCNFFTVPHFISFGYILCNKQWSTGNDNNNNNNNLSVYWRM